MHQDIKNILSGALDIVGRSGSIIAGHNTKPRNIRYKGRIDLVTKTDLAVEEFLKTELGKLCPEASFMAEESSSGSELAEAGDKPLWIIDPVDGTTNFAHKIPFVATSVALWRNGKPILGIVNAPLLGECFWAGAGLGAFCNSEPINVSGQTDIERALVATGFPYTILQDADRLTAVMNRVLKAAQGMRRCGAAALDLAFMAAGRFDAFYENGLKLWDVAAGMLIISEAGGIVSRYDGSAYMPGDDGIMASASPELHEVMRGLING